MSNIILNYGVYDYIECVFIESMINKIVLLIDELLINANINLNLIDDNTVVNKIGIKNKDLDSFVDDIATLMYNDAVDTLDYGLIGDDDNAKWLTDDIESESDIREMIEKYSIPIFKLLNGGQIPVDKNYQWRNGMLLLEIHTIDATESYEKYIGDDGEFGDVTLTEYI